MEDPVNNHNEEAAAPDHGVMMAVVSGDSDCADLSDDEEVFSESDAKQQGQGADHPNLQGDAFLYDEKLDEEDEAYVYMNLRGGKHSHVNKQEGEAPNKNATPKVQKPRNSDAVLSCPCCFQIVCMDSQQHHRYHNQYRAMFVMGITVDWEHRLQYDDKKKGLVRWYPDSSASPIVVPDPSPDNPIYYAVSCANCSTLVAALDMTDEVYHFYDCLASA